MAPSAFTCVLRLGQAVRPLTIQVYFFLGGGGEVKCVKLYYSLHYKVSVTMKYINVACADDLRSYLSLISYEALQNTIMQTLITS